MSIVDLPPPVAPPAGEDPFLAMPLRGVHLIEASAGTGKTYTLATLVTRLVVERGLRVGQILAVTFTEAATQELRERLRRRLRLTARVAAGRALPGEADEGEVALCRRLVERQCAVEDPVALRRRLLQAARELDLAAVHTIHGFCSRVLAEHALEAGEAFGAGMTPGDDRTLREAVAADLWRACAHDPDEADLLTDLWAGPDELARDLPALLRAPALRPDAGEPGPSPLPALDAAAAALRTAWPLHGANARALIDDALASGVLNRGRVRADTLDRVAAALDAWCTRRDLEPPDGRLDLFGLDTLAACAKKGSDTSALASPLFDAVAAYLDAQARHAQWRRERAVALVHRLRERARVRLAQAKRDQRVRSFDDLIDGVADALEGPRGDALVQALRGRFHAALVDEFQDTDARQWSIFRRVFGDDDGAGAPLPAPDDAPRAVPARFLALIGDPKQAIYRFRGGDVHTYLLARESAREAPRLARNFRSRPSVLQAVERLYAVLGDEAFVDPRIRFQPMAAGGRRDDRACLRDGAPAPALTVRRLPGREDGRDLDAEASRERATEACVEAVHETLALAAAGRLTIDGRAVEPGDIAVLVRKHDEALRIQRALAARGIAAIAAGRTSLFATEQALELLALFEALLAPADPARLNAALATALVGLDAAAIDALTRDDAARGRQLERAVGWRERWLRAGPLALVDMLCAQAAPRLLDLVDGERRLADFLQLGEAMQEAARHALGPQGQVDWLRSRIAGADEQDPEQQLRLESDARRVQILTVHKSKGLEFPFVFLPFAAIGAKATAPRWCLLHDAGRRVLHLLPDEACKALWAREEAAEEARLLYVALTRAEHALWVAAGPLYGREHAPLARMLADPARLVGGGIVMDDRAPGTFELAPLRGAEPLAPVCARGVRRSLARDWSIYSFSALARQASGPVETLMPGGGRDEDAADLASATAAPAPDADPRFAGARFGDVVHAAFETVDFAAWRDWDFDAPPPGQREALVAAFRAEGYPQGEIEAGLPLLTALVGHTLAARLPEGARLCELPVSRRRSEMEFHFTLDRVPVDTLLATVHAHGLLADRQGFGTRRVLDGLMTGKIDLVYAHDGRYFVLDYKTNRLPDYARPTLARAMHEGEYTLQAAIYTLALHRWLRFRLGEAYDYERHVGGLRYVFCRGVDARRTPAPGVHAQVFPRALIESLDTLFAGRLP